MYDTTKPYTEGILSLIRQTWETPFVSVENGIIKKKFNFLEASSTDGIGTKGIYHWKEKTFRNAVLDALAMNLNDLLMLRATPYKLQNHIFIPKENTDVILEIVETLVFECKKRNIAITGGETSVHDNIKGMDISLTIDGFVKRQKQNKFEHGDILIGIKSNGLHSNGFTKAREIFKNEFRKEFVEPTRIYIDGVLPLNENYDINGMMHITGGAFTKFRNLLIDVDLLISRKHKLKPQDIFYEIYRKRVSDEEMYKTFNCGIGFVLSVNKKDVGSIIFELEKLGLESDVIGGVISGNGNIVIESMFSEKEVLF